MKFRVFLFIVLGIANAFASDLDFTLVNQTARSFEGLYITDSANKDWDANLILSKKVLAAGRKIRTRFKRDTKSDTRHCNHLDDERLSYTYDHVKQTDIYTIT